jgi:hypothetical protein
MKNMKDSQPLKPSSPNRTYLRKIIEKIKPEKTEKPKKRFIDREALTFICILSFLISLILYDFKTGILSFLGCSLLVLIILIFFYRDILRYKPVYLKKKKMLLLLGCMMLLTLLVGRLFEHLFSVFSRGLGIESTFIHYFGYLLHRLCDCSNDF